MKKNTLFLMFLLCVTFLNAQSGNTISNAINVDGTNVAINLIDYNSATYSGLTPVCGSDSDVFYKHTISSGDNKLTIGMVSFGLIVLSDIEYQILRAPGGNINALEEIKCSSYSVPILANGSFQEIIQNITPGDVYYLRVYKPSGMLNSLLEDLLNATTITMVSEFDATLSINNTNVMDSVKIFPNPTSDLINIKLMNENTIYTATVSNIRGQVLLTTSQSTIDLSSFSKGVYILKIEDINKNTFIKQLIKN